MISVTTLLLLIAFVLTLVSGITGKVPLWVPVLLLCVALLAGVVIR
jgi:hypothetical protein